jgi:hypothetical protein
MYILIRGFGLFRMSFFAFFPPRLVAQTLFFSVRYLLVKICLIDLAWEEEVKRDINHMSIHAELQM